MWQGPVQAWKELLPGQEPAWEGREDAAALILPLVSGWGVPGPSVLHVLCVVRGPQRPWVCGQWSYAGQWCLQGGQDGLLPAEFVRARGWAWGQLAELWKNLGLWMLLGGEGRALQTPVPFLGVPASSSSLQIRAPTRLGWPRGLGADGSVQLWEESSCPLARAAAGKWVVHR